MENIINCLVFKIQDSLFGFDISYVIEILELPELKCLAELPSYIAGFFNLRGEVVQVLDMANCLGYGSQRYTLNDYVIILKTEQTLFGVIVSEIVDVKNTQMDQNLNFSTLIDENHFLFPLIANIVKFENELIFLVDPLLIYKKVNDAIGHMETLPFDPAQATLSLTTFNIDPKHKQIFYERAQRLIKPLITEEQQQQLLVAVFVLNQEYFGFNPELIREFCNMSEYTPIPTALPHILGVINLRGSSLPLIDMWQLIRFQKMELKNDSKIVIIDTGDLVLGIAVDEIINIISLQSNEIKLVPLNIEDEFIKYTALYQKEVLAILDVNKILDSIPIFVSEHEQLDKKVRR